MVHSKFIVSNQKEESEYDQEMPQSHTSDQHHGTERVKER